MALIIYLSPDGRRGLEWIRDAPDSAGSLECHCCLWSRRIARRHPWEGRISAPSTPGSRRAHSDAAKCVAFGTSLRGLRGFPAPLNYQSISMSIRAQLDEKAHFLVVRRVKYFSHWVSISLAVDFAETVEFTLFEMCKIFNPSKTSSLSKARHKDFHGSKKNCFVIKPAFHTVSSTGISDESVFVKINCCKSPRSANGSKRTQL